MPNYKYKCVVCDYEKVFALPISFDPSIKFYCADCGSVPGRGEDNMTRRIGKPTIPDKVDRVFAGDWYKKQYGHELGEGSMDKVRQAEDRKTLEREFRKRTGQ